jgi:hypothetical protein
LTNQEDDVSHKISAFSDHRCVELKLRMSETSHGMGVWKMNVDVIQSPTFQKVFTNWWKHWQTKKSQYPNVGVWWEVAKKKIKSLCIKVSNLLSQETKFKRKVLEDRIKELENMKERTHENDLELKNRKSKLQKIFEKKGEVAK